MNSLILEIVDNVADFVWGLPLIVLLVGSGLFLTLRLKFVQVRGFFHALAVIRGRYDSRTHHGQITHFQALCAALSATIGTGNIAGVATAIAVGGPGAVFWMWVTAFVGMAVKFSSCLLAVKYRRIEPDGTVKGGPMYYIEKGLGPKFKPLAVFFAFCTAVAAFGIGNMVQANSVADGLLSLFHWGGLNGFNVSVSIGLVLAFLTALVILGGIKRIGHFAALMVPFMTVAYLGSGSYILLTNLDKIPWALRLILVHAVNPTAAAGGFLGSGVLLTVRIGVARGIFSNESGLGTAPMIHAAARTDEPVREGLAAMLGPFVDTILICTMTAVVIVLSGKWRFGLTGVPLTSQAFGYFLPSLGPYVVNGGLCFFAFSTLVSWYYYGEKGLEYLSGNRRVLAVYKWFYIAAVPLGASAKLHLVWTLSDIANGLMALPNLIALLGLSPIVAACARDYFSRN